MQTSPAARQPVLDQLGSLSREFLDGLYFPPKRSSFIIFTQLWLAGLFLISLAQWGSFLAWGNIPFDRGDWSEISGPRLEFTRNALLEDRLPLHIPVSLAVKNSTDRFLAMPDLILSPQILALRWLDPGQFVLFQTLLMVSLGYYGLLLIRRRFRLGLVPFTGLFFLFFFNGHITAHLSVGHATWTGYFLLPFFVLLVYSLFNDPKQQIGWKWVAQVALLLLAIFLQGSFHQFVWCAIFLELVALFNREWFGRINCALLGAFLVSAVRIIPITLVSGSLGVDYFGGFLTAQSLLDGLVRLVPLNQSIIPMANDASLITWWEYDFYVGLVGLLVMVVFGVFPWKNLPDPLPALSKLRWPLAFMAFLSVGRIFNVVFLLDIPLLNAERTTTRFLIVPLVFLMVQAMIQLQRLLDHRRGEQNRQSMAGLLGLGILLLIVLINDLQTHFSMWQVTLLGGVFSSVPFDPADTQVINHADPPYQAALAVGTVISLAALVGLLYLASRARKTPSIRAGHYPPKG